MAKKLILQFQGWCLIRLPTDPDPPDEPRGVSGYSFAFGDEPDLDRLLRLQAPTNFKVRSYSPDINVKVYNAFCQDGPNRKSIDALLDARVNLLDEPKLQNRNWVLTLPGQEPIDPFHLEINGRGISLRRKAPIDPQHPDIPIWKIDQELILAQGARGMEYEPETIGEATGIWDSLEIARQRRNNLKADLEKMKTEAGSENSAEIAILEARIYQLNIGIDNPMDRRVAVRPFVERFGFPMRGNTHIEGDQQKLLDGKLSTDAKSPWMVNFWIGGWDPDLLCAFMRGSLEILYQP
jgi:hypothetical protein